MTLYRHYSIDQVRQDDDVCMFFVQAEDGIRYLVRSRGLGDVYKRQAIGNAYVVEHIIVALQPEQAAEEVQVAEDEIGPRHVHNPSQIPEPVSYTHLRAHETVLDLVCRLLLEKKKNESNSTLASRPLRLLIRY